MGTELSEHLPKASLQFWPKHGVILDSPDIPHRTKKEAFIGYWVGAPTAVRWGERILLSHRIRAPRGSVDENGKDMERGWTTVLSQSRDGFHFEEVGRLHKSVFSASSVEKCSALPMADGRWALYVSYASAREDETKGMWCIDRIVSSDLAGVFSPQQTPETVLTPQRCPSLEGGWMVTGIKDPFFLADEEGSYFYDGSYHMVASFSKAAGDIEEDLHGEGDCYNSGLIRSCTAYFTSEDGLHFKWQGEILAPQEATWFAYACRLTTAFQEEGGWWGVIDGACSVAENYNERSALVAGPSLQELKPVSGEGATLCPAFDSESPFGGEGGVRYVSAIRHLGRLLLYYEYTRYDGAHDLRVAEAELV